MVSKFETDLNQYAETFQPLTPLRFLVRSAEIFPERTAIIYGDKSTTWREHAQRCRQLGSALVAVGVQRGDTVAVMAPNTPPMLEAQFGVLIAGAVLNSINIRLDTHAIANILEHSEARVFLVDRQFSAAACEAVGKLQSPILVVDIDDPDAGDGDGGQAGTIEYEAFLRIGSQSTPTCWPTDEWDAIAFEYTLDVIGNAKNVTYHHRGAYLNALGQVLSFQMSGSPVYVSTLPLIHSHGWSFAWGLAALGGTHVCIRKVSAEAIYDAIRRFGVTHFCCAPTWFDFLIDGAPADWTAPAQPIRVMMAGASPPASILKKIGDLGFSVLYEYPA